MNYGQLKSNVAAWMKRSDLTSVIPTFVELAEADIAHDVRVQAMEQRASGTLTGGTLTHPARLIVIRQLLLGENEYHYVTPEVYESRQAQGDTQTWCYTSIGQTLYINGAASGDTYTLVYTQAFASLVNDSDTNWLTDNAPEVYLYAALRHANLYTLDDAGVAKYAQLYAGAVQRVNGREQRARYGNALWARTDGMRV